MLMTKNINWLRIIYISLHSLPIIQGGPLKNVNISNGDSNWWLIEWKEWLTEGALGQTYAVFMYLCNLQ